MGGGGGARGFIPLKGKDVGVESPTYRGIISEVEVGRAFSPTKSKIAFTLAEVLITLGIIGVVAAMTMPTLVGKYQEKVTISKLKKMNTVLNQAFQMAVKDHGTPDLWGYSSSVLGDNPTDEEKEQAAKGKNIVIDKFAPYLKTVSICYQGTECRNTSKYIRTRYSLDGTEFSRWGHPAIILADGAIIQDFYMSSPSCTVSAGDSRQYRSVCGEIFVDINGVAPPNATGKDVFGFRITKYGVYPAGDAEDTYRSFDEYCNITKTNELNGYGCAAWVIYNENMDYLKCTDLSWNGKLKCSR